ncbi:MAG: hypothetical protein AVDCRST_MAG29-350 [uncultured Nocardioidaceae bacterium]|uniref:Uncharacterized protein n=1 Tax=uncultured Nocardioidaceae bacterium TaxID=253824 RepID=A0A6J4L318_9ACTN|nr:MAG: hypothetical protein AVDCRST_MAG29-350 [uncultured Nocardioidaceae bacterium]
MQANVNRPALGSRGEPNPARARWEDGGDHEVRSCWSVEQRA